MMGEAPKQEQRQIMPQSLVWQRRQIPPQQAITRPAPMEGIERTNAVVVRGSEQDVGVPPRWDPYVMEIDSGRNCYACGGFEHMAHHCRNRERMMRRVEIGGGRFEGNIEQIEHLKEVENLEVLD